MTKKYKLHSLTGTLLHSFPRNISSKGPYHKQPYYLLTVQLHQVFTSDPTDIYAFPNLVNNWNTFTALISTKLVPPLTFHCEKRTRGWRLRDWEIKS